MPFASTLLPSLGLSNLRSVLESRQITAEIIHFNILFAAVVGQQDYQSLSGSGLPADDLLGEWVFTEAMWGPDATRDASYYNDVVLAQNEHHRKTLPARQVEDSWRSALRCREHVAEFLERCCSSVRWDQFSIVGFTTMFEQNLASLSLARALKARNPGLRIIFGGANCEGEMGLALLRNFEFIDAVCIGEGEVAFPNLIEKISEGIVAPVDGIVQRWQIAESRSGPASEYLTSAPPFNLETSPCPRFDEFFATHLETSGAVPPNARISVETSRGCWWGQKNHCTFCGLNGSTLKFRQKSADRAISDFNYLVERHGHHTKKFAAADNIIPFTYFEDFLPRLAGSDAKLDIFYETKANLKKDQLRLYRDAGLKFIQPGIESLDTGTLRLMRKGISAIQNVQLLKWCKELGITPIWNLITRFPGEDPSAYQRQADLIPHLLHLGPPSGVSALRIDRFSPYHSTAESFGIYNIRSCPSYSYIYPGWPQEELDKIAYFFVGDYPNRNLAEIYTARFRNCVRLWMTNAKETTLFQVPAGDQVIVFDLRDSGGSASIYALNDWVIELLRRCDRIISASSLFQCLSEHSITHQEFDAALQSLAECGLIMREGDLCLALPLSLADGYKPPALAVARLRAQLGLEAKQAARLRVRAADITRIIGGHGHRKASVGQLPDWMAVGGDQRNCRGRRLPSPREAEAGLQSAGV
jgi:ribosomal peptide maturation radical SAM protein 1